MRLNSKYIASSKDGGLSFPSYNEIAKAYGIEYVEISDTSECSKISMIMDTNKAVICNVRVDEDFRVVPQVVFGKPNEDMGPLLPRDIFIKNMLVKPLD